MAACAAIVLTGLNDAQASTMPSAANDLEQVAERITHAQMFFEGGKHQTGIKMFKVLT